ncbi:MAG: phospholipid/cholesterol/gamma-HCH transport system substrate-binding protein [Arenicella sp.]|jgi:phospholipid/cholesterol/gamma-HCH transport system substrate-binding protein
MRVSKEFKVGLLVVLGLLLLFIGVNFLKGGGIFNKNREFYAVFDNSSGLQPSNEVQMNGVKVGQVLAVDLKSDDATQVVVKFSVDNDELMIPDSSQLELISSDILGTKALDLQLFSGEMAAADLKYYESGDTFRFAKTQTSIQDQINQEILPLKKKTEELIGSVESIIVSVNAFWDTSAAYTIDESLYEVRDAIDKFGELANNLSVLISNETEQVDRILQDVHEITDNLANKSDKISNVIDNISAISDTLADSDIKSVIDETKITLTELNGILADVNSGQGTIGKLLHTDSLHNELIQTNQSLQNLLDDFEANPNKFVHFSVFGRKVKGYQTTTEREDILDNVLDSLQGI